MIRQILITLLVGGLLAACAAQRPAMHDPVAQESAEGRMWTDLASHWPGQPQQLTQLVTANFSGGLQSITTRVDVEMKPTGISMVALSPVGIPLYELVVSEGKINVKTYTGPQAPLPTMLILADFILAHWPTDVLLPALAKNGFFLTVTDQKRILYDAHGRALVDVTYDKSTSGDAAGTDKSRVHIKHNGFPLDLSVVTVMREIFQK